MPGLPARRPTRIRRVPAAVLALLVLAGVLSLPTVAAAAADPCAPVVNPVACENSKPGTPKSTWDVSGAGTSTIQGFPTQISVNVGERQNFKISTPARSYRLDIYRMGYYGGNGARLITTVNPSATLPQTQPGCLTDAASGLVDCGNWATSASWDVPATAVSGIYFAKLTRTDGTTGTSHVVFVVRDDARTSDMLFQTSDTTWQAYNQYGGNSLYVGSPAGRAYKVSYNRPITTRGTGAEDFVFNAEYPMVRFLEAQGYDVSYTSGMDVDRRGSTLLNHKAFLSTGHDEYWSGAQRANVEAARDAGVNLAFFSGNEVFWKTRWENSIDSSGTPYRTLVCYKDTHANRSIDPLGPGTWTGTWRDPRFSPPGDGGKPENALTGTSFEVNSGTLPLRVPAADGKMRFWRGTPVASQAAGATATLTAGTVGYEWDEDADNGFRPAGLIKLSTTTSAGMEILLDQGSTYGNGTATHNLTMYRASSGALVFGAGTVQWSWGLDADHDRGSAAANASMRQATVNLFADMGVQPATLQSGLTAAAQSADSTGPTVSIASPSPGITVPAGQQVTISGTATDTGGGQVGGVEVSTDDGATWRPATGRGTWTYAWTVRNGTTSVRARATDDSGNIGTAGSVAVTVGSRQCPCSIWDAAAVPASAPDSDTSSTELGVKFRSDTAGRITGLRFYKQTGNGGTHTGRLWSATGQQLASVTFTGESATGWQQANFGTPVNIQANTTYVASYLAPVGRYSADTGFFAASGAGGSPLRALRDGEDGTNGVYGYFGAAGGFPTAAWQSSNYWVDVVFDTATGGGGDTTPPTVTAQAPAANATGVATSSTVTATFSEALQSGTAAVQLASAAGPVAGTTAYDATTRRVTFTPSAALAASTAYTATVNGARDAAGNQMTPVTWTFTTAATAPTDTTPPTVTAQTPASGATGVAASTTVTATFSEALQTGTAAIALGGPGGAVAGGTTYDATARRVTLTPAAALAAGTTYTVTVSGARDTAGNLMTPVTWSFTTAAGTPPTGTCPCTLFPPTATPANPSDSETASVELGMKFRSDVAGQVTGVRFYKGAANTGTHTGSLWSSAGVRLATVTFTGETASGWQQANFATPVTIAANTTYVVSYLAPNGRYSFNGNYFGSAVDRVPLHAPASGSGSNGNGVYRYGAAGGFPNSTYQAANYWVDVTFVPSA